MVFRHLVSALLLFVLAVHCGTASEAVNGPAPGSGSREASLKILNREVMTFRSPIGTYSAEQRAAAAEVRVRKALAQTNQLRTQAVTTNGLAEIRVRGQTVFFIQPTDVNELAGETIETIAQQALLQLDRVVSELEELENRQTLLGSLIKGTLATAILAGFVWLLARNRRWVENRLIRFTADKADQIRSHTLRLLGLQNLVDVLRGSMTVFFWLATGISTFLWVEFMLQLFPHTRPYGEQLEARFFSALSTLGLGALHALPNLGIVFIVWAAARFATNASRRFFAAIARGSIHSRIFDPVTAPIAQRLATIMIWITAVIVAFPYIPGSHTPAFQGISVLAGLMISLGSGNLISQLVGGLVMVYNRTCRPGDFVRVGEFEGTISSVGFFSSRLVTGLNEEIVIPNSQLSNSALINYTRLNEAEGVFIPATVTIGYNTPWRQVHAMLQEAARRTPGIRSASPPVVLQKQLSDFYVEYELRIAIENPSRRTSTLSQLHAHIQDVFNEHGVQIMSPHYEADPDEPVIVPKARWHTPPAQEPSSK